MSISGKMNLPSEKYGRVETLENGRHRVRFERQLPYSPEFVWAALIEADQLSKWFPGLLLEAELGGKFEIWFSGDCEGPAHVTGEVTKFNSPSALQMGSMEWSLSGQNGGCLVTFTDILHVDSRGFTEFANSVLGGWHKYLDSLERHLSGGVGDPRRDPEVDYSKL